jgi:hypothetical protein
MSKVGRERVSPLGSGGSNPTKVHVAWSLAHVVALVRRPLGTYRDRWAWLAHPFHGPPTVLIASQVELGLG